MYYRFNIPINLKYIIKDIILNNFSFIHNNLVLKLYAKIFFICFIYSDTTVSNLYQFIKK